MSKARAWIEEYTTSNGFRYRIRWRDEDGEKHTHHETFSDKHDADKAKVGITDNIRAGKMLVPKHLVRVSEFFAMFVANAHLRKWGLLKPKTIEFFGRVFADYLKRMPDMQLSALTPQHMEKYRDLREQALTRSGVTSQTTVSMYLSKLRSAFHTARRLGYVTRDLFEGVEVPEAKEAGYLIHGDDMARLYEALKPSAKVFFRICMETGLRSGELYLLGDPRAKLTQIIDLDGNITDGLIVPRTKVRKKLELTQPDKALKTIPITPEIRDLCEMVMQSPKMLNMAKNKYFGRELRLTRIKLGLPQIRPHDCRHTNATRLAFNKTSIPELMQRLGWDSMATIKKYMRPVFTEVRVGIVNDLSPNLGATFGANDQKPRQSAVGFDKI